ncbi:hypothetical protein BsWGS_12533 [Bradybaena similaris]
MALVLFSPVQRLHLEIINIKQAVKEQGSEINEIKQLIRTLTSDHLASLEKKINSMQQRMEVFTTGLTSLEEGGNQDKILPNERSSDVESKLKEFEGRLLEAETNRRKDWNFYQQKLTDVDNLFKQVCQMVNGHVEPLRRLQGTLNEKIVTAERRQLVSSQLDSVNVAVEGLLTRVCNLESRGRQATVGFTAYLPVVTKMRKCFTMSEFTDVLCNEGKCFNPATGKFTAPRDGLYFASVTLRQRKEGKVDVRILVVRHESGDMKLVGKSATHSDKKCSTAVGVVKMKAGDALFIQTISVIPDISLSQYSSFTCYLIG